MSEFMTESKRPLNQLWLRVYTTHSGETFECIVNSDRDSTRESVAIKSVTHIPMRLAIAAPELLAQLKKCFSELWQEWSSVENNRTLCPVMYSTLDLIEALEPGYFENNFNN